MMSLDWIAIARPYAKAIFEVSLKHQTLRKWSETLKLLAQVTQDARVISIMTRPDITPEQWIAILSSIVLEDIERRFLELLVRAGRLEALPSIQQLFEMLRADYEKTIEAKVCSFEPLTEQQQDALKQALSHRLKREVHLTVSVDKALLGGVMVQAGDFVIDGSVRGKLHRLSEEMMK